MNILSPSILSADFANLGKDILEVYNAGAKYPTPVYKIGMQDVFGESGSAADLMVKYEIDGAGVYKQVKEFLAKF